MNPVQRDQDMPDRWTRLAVLAMRVGMLLVLIGLAEVLPNALAARRQAVRQPVPASLVAHALPTVVVRRMAPPPRTAGRATPSTLSSVTLLPDSQPDASANVITTPATRSLTPETDRGSLPTRLVIPAIGLNAPIVPVEMRLVTEGDVTYVQWTVPDQFAAGWQSTSALPGLPGNTVLDGHNNIAGAVFGHLADLRAGAIIVVYSGPVVHRYTVMDKQILLEKGQPIEARLRNARWIAPTNDERLTLVTCWPNTDNTYRLIVMAKPIPGSSSP